MVHPILSKLATSRARLLQELTELPANALDNQPANGGWSIRQNLTHLIASEEDHCRVIEAIARNQLDHLPTQLDRDTHNAERLAEMGILSLPQLLDALAAQHQRTETLFVQLDPTGLDQAGPHPVLGNMTMRDIFRMLAVHEQMHTREIGSIRADEQ